MMNAATDPSLCPLCAQANDCAMVNGGKTCWCFAAPIMREAIERVPVEQRGVACICQNCGREVGETTPPKEVAET